MDRYIAVTHERVAQELRGIAEQAPHPCFRQPLADCVALKTLYDRAVIARAACEAAGGQWAKYVREFASLDLADCAVLAVDDILDESQRRAGNPTLHTKWGVKTAILIAEAAKSLAAEMLYAQSTARHRAAFHAFEEMYRGVQCGQYLDILYESADIADVTENAYLEMVELTTGVQIAGCCKVGAILAGASPATVEAARLYGLYTGTVFQIRDDVIDYLDNENAIGKPPLLDVARGKKRLPLILAWKMGTQDDRRRLGQLAGSGTALRHEDKRWLAAVVTRDEVVEPIRLIAHDLATKAREQIERFPPSRQRRLLDDILAIGSEV